MDLQRLEHKCHALQWSTDDVDWDAPGRERVSEAQAASLAGFMGDLYWIESIAAIVFEAMAARADDPVQERIFRTFAIDEQRHADAELALMARWGMIPRGETPTPNLNAANLIEALLKNAHNVHPSVFSAIIPLTELVLDGALVKYLEASIDDPLCHEVFLKINADEARHLAMDFHMLEHYGREHSVLQNSLEFLKSFARPSSLYAMFFGYVPMLARGRHNVDRTGLSQDEIFRCMNRYIALSDRNPDIARHPAYRVMREYAKLVVSGNTAVGDALVRLSDLVEGVRPSRSPQFEPPFVR